MRNSMYVNLIMLSLFTVLAAGDFELVESDFLGCDFDDSELALSVIDIDNDGLLDLIFPVSYHTSTGEAYSQFDWWEQSEAGSTEFTLISTNFLNLTSENLRPTFTDLDGDGLKDMIVGDYRPGQDIAFHLLRYEQVSANDNEFELRSDLFSGIQLGYTVGSPFVCDLDNDNRLDLLIGIGDGTIYHYEANSANSLNYSLVTTSSNDIDVGDFACPYVSDYNCDGLLDMFVGRGDGSISYFEQDEVDSYSFSLITDDLVPMAWADPTFPSIADIDNDGYLDLLVGDGMLYGSDKIHRFEIKAHVSTHEAAEITASSAVVGVTTEVNSALTYGECGICWSTSPSPTTSDSAACLGSGIGSFTTTLTGLDAHLTYYVRGYVYDQYGMSYGEEKSFSVTYEPMTYDGIACYQTSDPIFRNSQDQPLLRIELETSGPHDPLIVYQFNGFTSESTNSSHDIDLIKIYYTGTDPEFSTEREFGSSIMPNPYWEVSEQLELMEGTNYFWVCCDVSSDATVANIIDCKLANYWIFNETYAPFPNGNPAGSREIISLDNECGYALEFDGVDDMVEIADSPGLEMDDTFTISAWVYPDDLDSRYSVFSTRATNQAGGFQLEVGCANGGINRVAVTGVGTWIAATTDNAILPGEWNHIACARCGSQAGDTKIYVNGEEMPLSVETAYDVVDNDDPIRIASGTNSSQFFNGKIDEVRLWDVVRTPEEIREAMHIADAGGHNELVGNWQFNVGAGTVIEEKVHDLDGTMVNMSDDSWVVSDIPFGGGRTASNTEANGWLFFGGTGLKMNYSMQSGAEVTVTRLDNAPNVLPSLANDVYDDQYWIVNRSDDAGFEAELCVIVNEDIPPASADNPQTIKLFTRPLNSSGDWSYLQTAQQIDSSYRQVRLPNVEQAGQYMLGTIDLPQIVSVEPQDDATDSHLGGNVRMEFNCEMSSGSGNIFLKRSSDDAIVGQAAASEASIHGCVVEIDFGFLLESNESYYLEVEPTAFKDAAYSANFLGLSGRTAWNFTTGSYTPALGSCIHFDGSNDYVSIGNSSVLDITGELTVECWIRPESHTDWARIITTPGTFAGKYTISLGGSEGMIAAAYYPDGDDHIIRKSYGPPIEMNKWNHIAFAVTSDAHAFLYINGVRAIAGSDGSFGFAGEDVWIGARQDNIRHFQGSIDELRIWDYARSDDEIAQNMCIPIDPLTDGLKCYLQMNEGVGDTCRDVMGGNNGVLGNMSRSGWRDSTIPFGEGDFQRIAIGETGMYAFDQTGIDLEMTLFTIVSEDSLDVYCNRLEGAPNTLPDGVDNVFDSQYWAIETWGDQLYEADITFQLDDDVTASDEANPDVLTLYKRGFGSDGNWVQYCRACAVSSAEGTVTFSGVSGLSQFIIARDTNFPSPEGVPGNSLTFDGVNDYVELANEEAYDFTTSFTAECWFKPTSENVSTQGSLISKDWNLAFMADPAMTVFMFNSSFAELEYMDVGNTYINHWNHIAVTYEYAPETSSGSISMYLNGDEVATSGTQEMIQNTSDPVRIGADSYAYPSCFEGQIDQVRLWSACQTQQEIREHMHTPVLGIETGLVSVFQFNEGSGTALSDPINGMTGILTNMESSSWANSTIPFGAGRSVSAVAANGIVNFVGTRVQLNFSYHSGNNLTVSCIELAPNLAPDSTDVEFDDLYWIADLYGEGAFLADMTVTLDDSMQVDENEPSRILLFSRENRSDGAWQLTASASSVDASANTATFSDISSLGQYMVGKWIVEIDPPHNLAIEIVGAEVMISWDNVSNVTTYRVYACDCIDGSYMDVTESGTFDTNTRMETEKKDQLSRSLSAGEAISNISRESRTTWSMALSGEMKHFYVTSSTETLEQRSL